LGEEARGVEVGKDHVAAQAEEGAVKLIAIAGMARDVKFHHQMFL